MNLVLFEPGELGAPLRRDDPRALHLLGVLRRGVGDPFDAGVTDGPLGQATLTDIGATALRFEFRPQREPPPLPNIHLLVGLPRPSTARDILRDATTCGVRSLQFVSTERTQASYAQSSLWTSGEWRRLLLIGAAQAFDTRLPIVRWGHTLQEAAALVGDGTLLALDNYEATAHLAEHRPAPQGEPTWLAVGPERGWGAADREVLRGAGFTLHHLGPRVLRVEMAVVAAHAVVSGANYRKFNIAR